MAGLFEAPLLQRVAQRHAGAFRIGVARRRQLSGLVLFALALLGVGLFEAEFSVSRFYDGLFRLGDFTLLMMPPNPGPMWVTYLSAIGETLAIAMLGTAIAGFLAFPFAVLASRNVLPVWISRFLMRRSFDTIRGVDTLIWALIWIGVVGLGPFAGVLAIATSDFGAFGKLFSETIENVDPRPSEGIRSTGGTLAQEFRYGALPQALPLIAGQILYYFESNIRSASIIGIVGAGGIGLHLSEQIRTLEWPRVAFIVLMILVVVAVIDFGSTKLRVMITGARPV
jgi:phosphonate transport system permease protein